MIKVKARGENRRTAAEIYISRFTDICVSSRWIIHYRSLYNDFFSFSAQKLHEPRFIQTAESVCADYKQEIDLLDLQQWIRFCKTSTFESIKDFKTEDGKINKGFQSETILLISYILNSPEFAYLDEVQIDEAEEYIGWGMDEVLSSDKKISSLSFMEKLAIARRLLNPIIHQHLEEVEEQEAGKIKVDIDKITKIIGMQERLSPKHSIELDEIARGEWLYESCRSESVSVPDLLCPGTANEQTFTEQWVRLNDNPQFVANTEDIGILTKIDSTLSEKIKTAGFYLFKEALSKNEGPGISLYIKIGAIADPIEVYKKGEQLLNPYSIQEISLESKENYSVIAMKNRILQALICGTEAGRISDDFFLIPPKMFTGTEALCESLSRENPDFFSRDLFRDPIFVNGKHYETAYLALEELVRDTFYTEEELMDRFKTRTSHLKEEAYQGKLKDLDNLVERFLISNLIPAEETFKGSCSELKAYYDIYSERDFSGLEISLVQINHNLNQLRELKELGVGDNVNRDKQDDIHCEVLNLLQGWYDHYVDNTDLDGKPTPLMFPDESFLKELMAEGMAEAKEMAKAIKEGRNPYKVSLKEFFIRKIQNQYQTINLTYVDKGFLFYDILREFAPEYNDAETVNEKIEYGNEQFKGSVNQQFANWEAGGWWSFSPLLVGAYKAITDRSEEEIQEIVGEVIEGQICEYPLYDLTQLIGGKTDPHYASTFPPVQAPINENCKLGFDDERERMIYSTLVSLYKSLDRFYSSFGFLIQTQKLKSAFER